MQDKIQSFIEKIENKKLLIFNLSWGILDYNNEKELLFINKTINLFKVI